MSTKTTFLAAAILASLPFAAGAEETITDLKLEAGGLIKNYATTLQAALKGALEASGPVGGISFCHEQAPLIAADISRRSGWSVGRTSLKVRNVASTASAYDMKAMEEFTARIAQGEAVSELTKAEVVDEDGAKVFHFVKAIPTGEVCLTCHGEAVKPEIKAKLDELYPGDKATGFKVGDMRGVFTLSKRL